MSRRLTLPAHGAIELIVGIAMMLCPILLSFAPAGLVISILLGAVLTGAAVTLNGNGGYSAAFHNEFDAAFVVVTALAAFVLAIAGQGSASLLLAAAVLTQAVLRYTTRYVATG